MAVAANKLELLQIADAVAREKTIERSIVIAAMEDAIAKAARSRYGAETDVHAEINSKTGELRLSRHMMVVDKVENSSIEMTLEDARRHNPAAQVGDTIADTLPPLEYGRIAAQSAKQVIVQKVREAERDRQYAEYKDRIGEIVNGVVKRVEYGNAVLDLGRGEAVIRRDELLPRETFRNGDRVRAYVYDVRREPRGPQIFLSRTHPQFMAKLFTQEVPEIYDGIIEIKAVARDPGSRAKIAVISRDSSVDPVGACVGMRGSRVQAVVNELAGEKIDIIPWSQDVATFVVNALAPAEVVKVVLDEVRERIEVVVPDAQLSLAIGRRGQNVRLASQLTGWDIDILTEAEESERRQKEFAERSNMFMESLDVDETVAQLLSSEGFTSVEDLAFVPIDELAGIEGFDTDTATELQNRAKEFLDRIENELDDKRKALGVKDLAGCATDDLIGWTERKDGETQRHAGFLDGFELDRDAAESLIMQARVKAGWVDETALAPAEAEEAEAEEAQS
jgi:N utilization substance protein A